MSLDSRIAALEKRIEEIAQFIGMGAPVLNDAQLDKLLIDQQTRDLRDKFERELLEKQRNQGKLAYVPKTWPVQIADVAHTKQHDGPCWRNGAADCGC